MARETSTQKMYVYTGGGAIRTEDGLRTNINGNEDTAAPFLASVGWLQRHAPVRHRLTPLEDWEAEQAKAEAGITEAASAEALGLVEEPAPKEEAPKAVKPKVRKAKKADKE